MRPHGTRGRYEEGCRCNRCKKTESSYSKARRARGGPVIERERKRGNAHKKANYKGLCEDCGAPTTGTQSGLDKAVRWCVECGKKHAAGAARERARPLRELIERMWAEGATLEEIAEAAGWKAATNLHARISNCRTRGYNLPKRPDRRLKENRQTTRSE